MVEKKKNTSGRGMRDLQVRVKSAKGRKLSSTLWLKRQLNDPYVARATKEGYRGRAAFKIMELDDKFRFLVPGARIVDLGCAPGGWCQVAVKRVNANGDKQGKKTGTIVEHELIFKRRKVPYKGVYSFTFEQAITQKVVDEVLDLSLEVRKSEEQ